MKSGVNFAIIHGQLLIVKAFVADCADMEARHDGTVAVSGPGTHSCVSLEKNGDPKHKQVH